MADKKFNLVFEASMEIGQVKSAVNQLTKTLESAGANLPKAAANNLNRLVQNLSNELNKIEGLSDIQLDPKQAKQVGQSYEKILSTFQQLKTAMRDIQSNIGIDPEKFFPKEIANNISNATAAIAKYKKALEGGIKSEEYSATTKELFVAQKKLESLQKQQDDAARDKRVASIAKDNLEKSRKELQANKDQAEQENKAAQAAEKAAKEKVKTQEKAQKRLGELSEQIAKKQKDQQEAVNRAAKASEEKQRREAIGNIKNRGTNTKAYEDAVTNYENNIQEVQRLQAEIEELQAEYAKTSQIASESVNEIAAAQQRAIETADRLKDAQDALKSNERQTRKQDEKIMASDASLAALAPEIQQTEEQIDKLIQKKEELETSFKEVNLNNLIEELEKIGIIIPESERSFEGIMRAIAKLKTEAGNKAAESFEELGQAVNEVGAKSEGLGRAAQNTVELGEAAARSQREMESLKDQVFDFFSISNTIQIFKNAIRDAFETVKELDAAMTETAVVTDFSIGDMWDKLPEYSDQATKLGTSIKSLYEATTLYYQQGLNSDQAMGVGIETMKMARIANMDAAEATEAMTAALRGFNMEINEASATRINDVYSELAAITASDTEQIATAMSKTASIADSANMEFETTAALLAQIIETTQEAPETAGTAMKTIIARFTEVKQLFSEGLLTGKDIEGEEISINKIDTALKTVGISLTDFLNGTKGIDDIFLELASKWDTLDLATQRYIATTAAGSRQQSRFIAMMSNYDRTMELVNAANNSAGASQEQFGKTLESLDAKLQRLSNAWQEFTMGLANNEVIKGAIDFLTWLLETVNKVTGIAGNDGLGGIITMFTRLATVMVALAGGKAALGGIVDFFKEVPSSAEQTAQASSNILSLFTSFKMEKKVLSKTFESVSKLGSKTTGMLGGLSSAFGAATNGAGAFALGLGKIAIVIGAVVGVIALLKYAYDSWYSSTAEGKLEAAQEATQQAGEAAEKAKEEYNGLKTALDSIQSKQSTLENMARGTDEWRNAVRELNNEVLTLIQNYPELGQFVSSSGGVLKIDYDKSIQRGGQTITASSIIQDHENQTYMAETAKYLAQVAQVEAQTQVDYEKSLENVGLHVGKDYQYSRKEVIDAVADAMANGEILPDAAGNYRISKWLNNSKYGAADTYLYSGVQGETLSMYNDELLAYGQKRAANKQEREAYLDSAVASAMAMAKLQNETSDSVMGLDRDLLRAQMEQSVEQGKALYSTLTDLDRQKFADSMGYTYKNGAFYDSDNKKVKQGVSDSDVQNYLGALKGSEIMTSNLESISKNLESMGAAGETLGSLLSDEGGEISEELLKSFAGDAEKTIPEQLAQIASKAGYEGDIAKLAQQLGIADENSLINLVRENLMIASEQRHKERINLAKDLKKHDKLFSSIEGESGLEAVANYMQHQEEKRGGEFRETFSKLINSVQASGDNKIITEAISNFRKMSSTVDTDTGLFKYTNEDLESISNLMAEINWSNPIQAASKLTSELENGSIASKEYAQSLLQVENSFLGAGSQMRFFIQSTEYSELREEIEKTIDTQGELSGMDVYNLADSCESLQMIMENTGITAEGLAQALTMIDNGTMGMHQLTDAVMAALSGFSSLDTVIHSALKGIQEFDAGPDENNVASFVNTAYETLSGNIKKGAWGNSQNQKYLDFLLGSDWDKGLDGQQLSGKAYEERLKYATTQLGKNKDNLGASWRNLTEGKNFWGEKIEGSEKVDGYTTIGDSGLKVKKNTDGSVDLEGFEGMTTDQLVSELAEAYNVSEQYAEMMLTDFANYSSDLRQELDLNDFSKGIEQAYEKTTTLGLDKITGESKKIMDKSEIQAIADAYGKNYEEVEQQLEKQAKAKGENFHITDFYDKDGALKSTEELVKQINDISDTSNFAQGFTTLRKESGGEWSKVVDYDALMAELENVNLPESAKQNIANSLIQSIDDGFTSGQTQIEHTFSNGITMPVEVEEGETVEQAITRMEKQIENSALGEAIAEAFKEVEIQFKFSEEVVAQAQTQFDTFKNNVQQPIQVTIEGNTEPLQTSYGESRESIEGNPINATINYNAGTTVSAPTDTSSTQTVTPVVDPGALGTVTSQISGAVDAADTNVVITGSGYGAITQKINSAIPSSKTIAVNVKLNQSTIEVSGAASATITLRAYRKGLDKAGFTHDALVSENGPELIQTKDGAYLSGLNGPEIVTINKGDKVYTAEETKKIFSSKNHDMIPRFARGYGDGSGGGTGTGVTTGTGRQSSTKENEWENPYDMLYNLVNYIDRTIRERERIERKYERLLEQIGATAEEIYNISVEQLEELSKEKIAQEELKQKRQQQIVDEFDFHTPEWLKKWFIPLTGEGDKETDYYRFDENGELIFEIDWDKINAEKSTSMGEAIEEFISKLEEWQDSIEEANDSLEDIEDQIEEIKQRGKEEYADIEERIHDALVSSYQSQIDKLNEINNSISNTNSDLINAIQNSITKMRQDRENEKTEQNLAEQQRRLAYLKQNSAGNELEIKKLEEQLEQQQENYTDSLVDQKIAELQQQNDEAAQQRERQIEIAQAQLDQYVETGAIWQEIHKLMVEGLLYTEGLDLDSVLADILKNSEEFDGMSEMQQVEWLKELNQTIASALAYIKMNYSGFNMDKVYDTHETGSTPLPYGIKAQYATGGLADFTGPAWLDGTKTKPELILNAQDTKNFIQLKDILGSIMTGKTNNTAQNSGDSIYDIDINVENISNDYDVERMAKKIEALINENARYRNNNAISLKR